MWSNIFNTLRNTYERDYTDCYEALYMGKWNWKHTIFSVTYYWIPFYPACGIERYKCNSTTIYDTSAEIKVASNKAFHLIFLYLEFGKIPNKGILFRASRQSEVLRRIAPLNNPLTKNFHFCVRPLMIFTALGLNACYFFMT